MPLALCGGVQLAPCAAHPIQHRIRLTSPHLALLCFAFALRGGFCNGTTLAEACCRTGPAPWRGGLGMSRPRGLRREAGFGRPVVLHPVRRRHGQPPPTPLSSPPSLFTYSRPRAGSVRAQLAAEAVLAAIKEDPLGVDLVLALLSMAVSSYRRA